MFTLEIAGRPVAVINVPTREDAEELLKDEEFREDLTILRNEGRPLWNGQEELRLRDAKPEEQAEYESSDFHDGNETDGGGSDDEGDGMVMFIVDVTDPDDPDDAHG